MLQAIEKPVNPDPKFVKSCPIPEPAIWIEMDPSAATTVKPVNLHVVLNSIYEFPVVAIAKEKCFVKLGEHFAEILAENSADRAEQVKTVVNYPAWIWVCFLVSAPASHPLAVVWSHVEVETAGVLQELGVDLDPSAVI